MSSEFSEVKLFGAPRCNLAESPRWAEGHWWWVDAEQGIVFWRPGGALDDLENLPISKKEFKVRTSMVQPIGNSRFVVAVANTLKYFEFKSNDLHEIAKPVQIQIPENWLLNDGIADIAGNIWIGTVSPDLAKGTGELLRINKSGEIKKALPRFSLSNGMAWDHKRELLYHVDSYERIVWQHQVNVLTGDILDSKIFIQLATDDGLPDGISLDSEGRILLAIYGKYVVRFYDLNANFLNELSVPAEQVTSIAIGGFSESQLLITTAQENFTKAQSEEFPLAGQLFISQS
jgi:sugar lactone lactonase YvrE